MRLLALFGSVYSCDLVSLKGSENAFCRCSADFCDALQFELPSEDHFFSVKSDKQGARLVTSYNTFASSSSNGLNIQLFEDWFKLDILMNLTLVYGGDSC